MMVIHQQWNLSISFHEATPLFLVPTLDWPLLVLHMGCSVQHTLHGLGVAVRYCAGLFQVLLISKSDVLYLHVIIIV